MPVLPTTNLDEASDVDQLSVVRTALCSLSLHRDKPSALDQVDCFLKKPNPRPRDIRLMRGRVYEPLEQFYVLREPAELLASGLTFGFSEISRPF